MNVGDFVINDKIVDKIVGVVKNMTQKERETMIAQTAVTSFGVMAITEVLESNTVDGMNLSNQKMIELILSSISSIAVILCLRYGGRTNDVDLFTAAFRERFEGTYKQMRGGL